MIRLLQYCIFFVLTFSLVLSVEAQRHNLTIIVKDDAKHPADSIFVAGNFNGWNPGKAAFALHKQDSIWTLVIPSLPPDLIEFKITKGSWSTVETGPSGSDQGNHVFKINKDTTVNIIIAGWKDAFPAVPKKHTASANVQVLDSAFWIPQLQRYRRITIYLPPGYKTGLKRFPVLYMHDGQNLFDEYTAGYGEWGVDECLDSLISIKKEKPCIVVGIDNGPHRLTEYNPFYFEQFGKGEGDAYVNFIARTLKPFIDSAYRTLSTAPNTIIAGSSMGGLISYYAALKYPQTFGKAGIFSPAFWTADSLRYYTNSTASKQRGLLFFYMGKLEGKEYLNDMVRIVDVVGRLSKAYIYTAIDDEGAHNEQAWRKWFPQFYQWVINDGNNHIINTKD